MVSQFFEPSTVDFVDMLKSLGRRLVWHSHYVCSMNLLHATLSLEPRSLLGCSYFHPDALRSYGATPAQAPCNGRPAKGQGLIGLEKRQSSRQSNYSVIKDR